MEIPRDFHHPHGWCPVSPVRKPSRSQSAGRLVGHFDAVLQHLHREALRRHGREPKAETSGTGGIWRNQPWEKMGNMEWNIPFFDGFWFHVSHLFHLSQFWLCTIRNFWTWLFYGFWWWKGGCLNITHIILRTYFLRLVAYVCCMDDMQESEANHFHFPSHLSLWKCWRNIRNWLSCIWMTFEELSCWTLACFPLQCRRAACASPN